MNEQRFKTNPKYKDRLFCLIFGDENEKQNIISLYNALNGTNYSEDEEVEVTTIRDVIYINMKNDVSFIVDSHMSLFEQQSSVNPNMPLRGLMYFGNLYDSYIESRGLNIYGSKLVKIPTPQYYVLYNGKAFEDAVDAAVQYCIANDILKEFLVAHRAEVVSVCLTEFNEKVFVDAIKEEGREEGRTEGERSMLVKLVKKGCLSIEEAVEELQMSKEEFMCILEQ